ncbi:hypothetical protein KHQ81_01490 [Mycoplasmatota bacterium]|nr:hypothetical protein KHQ81_01490 [Mycoplasmatota bacterium]
MINKLNIFLKKAFIYILYIIIAIISIVMIKVKYNQGDWQYPFNIFTDATVGAALLLFSLVGILIELYISKKLSLIISKTKILISRFRFELVVLCIYILLFYLTFKFSFLVNLIVVGIVLISRVTFIGIKEKEKIYFFLPIVIIVLLINTSWLFPTVEVDSSVQSFETILFTILMMISIYGLIIYSIYIVIRTIIIKKSILKKIIVFSHIFLLIISLDTLTNQTTYHCSNFNNNCEVVYDNSFNYVILMIYMIDYTFMILKSVIYSRKVLKKS